jgi:polyhydroxyalkanoate synthase
MKTFDPQAMYSEWMSQLGSQAPWQDWVQPVRAMAEMPVSDVLKDIGAKIDPAALARLQSEYMQEFGRLWQDFALSKLPELNDKRFSATDWHNHAMHSYSAASYLLNARFLMAIAEAVEAPQKIKQKISFAVQQMIDAMSPANFLVTNPEAQSKLIESKGESLARGISQMLADMQKGAYRRRTSLHLKWVKT